MNLSNAAVAIAALIVHLGCSHEHNDNTGGAGGSAGSGGAGGSGGALTDVCPASHQAVADNHQVTVCESLFPEAPRVRPPADDATVYVATDGLQLFARGAEPRDLASDERSALGLDDTNLDSHLYGFTIYAVTRDGDGHIVAGAPAIVIEDAAFLSLFEGKTIEGLVSRHVADGNFEYEQDPTLPIRLRAEAISPVEPVTDTPAAPSQIELVVENLETGAMSSKGSCLAPIVDAGDEIPFAGSAEVALRFYRVPGMHGIGDNELVVDGSTLNHMAPAWMVMPHQLLLDADIVLEKSGFMAHGNPLSMPQLELAFVEGGGETCTP